jgi:hypothetical protein
MTTAALQAYDELVVDVRLKGATASSYCLESAMNGETWSARPDAGIARGGC